MCCCLDNSSPSQKPSEVMWILTQNGQGKEEMPYFPLICLALYCGVNEWFLILACYV